MVNKMGTKAMLIILDDINPEKHSTTLFTFSDGYPEFIHEQLQRTIRSLGHVPSREDLVETLKRNGWTIGSTELVDINLIDYFYVLVLGEKPCIVTIPSETGNPVKCLHP